VKRFHYGGQAVIEGVMIRGQRYMVTAVRRPDGGIAVDTQPLPKMAQSRARRVPVVRGLIVLIETLMLGIRSLTYSANVSMEEENEKLSGGESGGIVAMAVAFAVGVFFIAPLFITRAVSTHIESVLLFNLVEGFIRLGFFVAYLKIIGLSASMKRVFAYHGAEHKTINAFEAGVALEVGAVRDYSTAHRRCGTSFLFIVLVIAIFVFAFIGRPALWLMVLLRVVLIPVIAGLGYEAVQFSARHENSAFVRALVAPGLWLQSMTTAEPDDKQLEVAIASLSHVMQADEPKTEPVRPPL
jgi:uncharacterized protein YqhQ